MALLSLVALTGGAVVSLGLSASVHGSLGFSALNLVPLKLKSSLFWQSKYFQ